MRRILLRERERERKNERKEEGRREEGNYFISKIELPFSVLFLSAPARCYDMVGSVERLIIKF